MAVKEVEEPVGTPWQRPLAGVLDTYVVESDALSSNPLGDPARRPLYVYRSPRVVAETASDVAAVYFIQGFTGQLDMVLSRTAFEPSVVERVDAMFSLSDCPDAVVVFVDAWTSLGGSQFLNSSATGRYLDYLCDEVVPFVDERYPTRGDRERRGITGKSSGGYGAMVVPMLRPDVFGALASHSGDALFECCYLPHFREIARALRDHFEGSYEVFFERLKAVDHFDYSRFGTPLELYAYAAAYSPDPSAPGRVQLPFDPSTGRLVDAVWERWLALDPVRMVSRHAGALRTMRRVHLEAGRADEAYLDLGAQAVAHELARVGVPHTFELFDGRHGGISYRYPAAIRELVRAMQ